MAKPVSLNWTFFESAINKEASLPSSLIISVSAPLSFALNIISLSDTVFLTVISSPDSLIVNSLRLAPIVNEPVITVLPVLLATVNLSVFTSKSLATCNLLFIETSSSTYNFWFMETSPVAIVVSVEVPKTIVLDLYTWAPYPRAVDLS